MSTKSVTVKESAYEILRSRKRENESFSDVIERIAKRRPITDLTEVISDEDGEAIAEEIEKARDELDEEVETGSKQVRDAVE